MSAPKFTPGPWKIRKLNVSFPVVETDNEVQEYICGNISGSTNFEAHANAALIAAAPEMYEFIELSLTWFTRNGDQGYATKAKEILNKARGNK